MDLVAFHLDRAFEALSVLQHDGVGIGNGELREKAGENRGEANGGHGTNVPISGEGRHCRSSGQTAGVPVLSIVEESAQRGANFPGDPRVALGCQIGAVGQE